MSHNIPKDAAYFLARALHLIRAAASCFDQTIIEAKATHDAKSFLKDRARECNRIFDVVVAPFPYRTHMVVLSTPPESDINRFIF